MTGCTPGGPGALRRSLAATGIKFETSNDGEDISWSDPKDGQDEVATFFHNMDACIIFMRSDDYAWFAYAGERSGCVKVLPTQEQVIAFHRKKDALVIARSYEDGSVIIIKSMSSRSALHILNIRGLHLCKALGPVFDNASEDNLSIMQSRKL
jgi:hypothetical protein